MNEIAILRRCVRCKRYESIDNFGEFAKVCQPCMYYHIGGGRIGRGGIPRNIAITESGRRLLAQWRREEMGAA